MSNQNYDDLPEVEGEIINWDEVGQVVCGTYVGKSKPINTKFGVNHLYEIKNDEGEIVKFWGRKIIDDKMKFFKFGTKVKVHFVASRPSKMGNDWKEIKVYGNPKIVDEEWLSERSEMTEASNEPPVEEATEEATDRAVDEQADEEQPKTEDPEKVPFLTKEEKEEMLAVIIKLSEAKLGTKTAEEAKEKVMEATSLAFIDVNLLKIIEAMEDLPERK